MLRLPHQGNSGVVWDVEPFMAIDRPGIGRVHAFEEWRVQRGDSAPKSESAIDVDPGASLAGAGTDFLRRIEGASIYIAGLDADHAVFVENGQRVSPHPSLPVGRYDDHARAAQAQHRQCFQYRNENFFANHDPNRRSLEQTI